MPGPDRRTAERLRHDARGLERDRELAEWAEDDAYAAQVRYDREVARARVWHRFRVRLERLFWHDLYDLDAMLALVGRAVRPQEPADDPLAGVPVAVPPEWLDDDRR